jgi:hypothetical protein
MRRQGSSEWREGQDQMMDNMRDESESVTREQASAAVREQVERLSGPPGVTVPMIVGALQVAVRHGTELFNGGDVEGCFELYRDTADWLLQEAGRQPGQRPAMVVDVLTALEGALERARRGSGYHDRAWSLRHTFDWLMADHYAEMRRVVGLWMMSQAVISRGDFDGAVAILDSALRNATAIRGGVDAEEEGAHVSWMAQLTAGHARLLSGDVSGAWTLISEVLLLAPHTLSHVPNLSRAGAHWKLMVARVARACEQSEQGVDAECFRAYLMLQGRDAEGAVNLLSGMVQQYPTHEGVQMLLALAIAAAAAPVTDVETQDDADNDESADDGEDLDADGVEQDELTFAADVDDEALASELEHSQQPDSEGAEDVGVPPELWMLALRRPIGGSGERN